MMELLRQVDAQYVRKGTQTPRADLNAVASEYRKGGVVVVWVEPVWTGVQYNSLMTQALNPDHSGESAAYVRNRASQRGIGTRRQLLRDWGNPVNSYPNVKQEITNYNQWFGCLAGSTLPNESAAQFTLPGKAVVMDRYIEAIVANYITKGRTVNDKKRKWKKFKANNPAVADAELRVRFFNQVLKQAERNKLLPTIRQRYQQDQWQGVRPDAGRMGTGELSAHAFEACLSRNRDAPAKGARGRV